MWPENILPFLTALHEETRNAAKECELCKKATSFLPLLCKNVRTKKYKKYAKMGQQNYRCFEKVLGKLGPE